jgi:hypothetical protein
MDPTGRSFERTKSPTPTLKVNGIFPRDKRIMAGLEIALGSLFSVLHPTKPRNEHVTMELAPRCPSLCRTKMIYATFTAPKQYGPGWKLGSKHLKVSIWKKTYL